MSPSASDYAYRNFIISIISSIRKATGSKGVENDADLPGLEIYQPRVTLTVDLNIVFTST